MAPTGRRRQISWLKWDEPDATELHFFARCCQKASDIRGLTVERTA
jgi:hypothetical protein